MTDDEIQLAIAVACGWEYRDREYTSAQLVKYWAGMWHNDSSGACGLLPKYTTDLNAMNEAEKRLSVKEASAYVAHLGEVVLDYGCTDFRENPYMLYLLLLATPRQRAEAFLRTLGKWCE